MQRIGANGRRINLIISVALLFVFVILDQLTKCYFHQRKILGQSEIVVIKNFFTLDTSFNTGAGFSFLSNESWAQTFFIILTSFALIALYVYFLWQKDKYIFLNYGIMLLFAGIIGNFIDRLAFGYVVDFLSFKFGSYYFPTFNVADVAITVGVIIVIYHYFFLDKDALFKSKKAK